jgi:hypothetical protein
MKENERSVGGLWCREVLALLSDYLDGRLTVELRAQVETHVRGCQVCEQFGGSFAKAVTALRRQLQAPASDEELRLLDTLVGRVFDPAKRD